MSYFLLALINSRSCFHHIRWKLSLSRVFYAHSWATKILQSFWIPMVSQLSNCNSKNKDTLFYKLYPNILSYSNPVINAQCGNQPNNYWLPVPTTHSDNVPITITGSRRWAMYLGSCHKRPRWNCWLLPSAISCLAKAVADVW